MTLVKVNRNNGLLKPYSFIPEMKTILDEFFNDSYLKVPAVNISEDENKYNLELSVPGFNKENFKINLENNAITISGEVSENKSNEDKNYTRKEFTYQSFSRSFNLPENINVDEISANYENGILNITLPKLKDNNKNSRLITVN